MSAQHPLLKKINIDSTSNIHDAFVKIRDLGLSCKIHDTKLIVKYPKSLKYSDKDYIRTSRGIIIDYETKKVINRSLEGSLDITTFNKIVPNWNSVVIEECLDGVLLNVYYDNDKWNISTKFCLNADESKFRMDHTFRQLFDSLFVLDFNILDKSYTYSFLLQHTLSRNVSLIRKNKLYHLESTNNVTGDKIQIKLPGLNYPKILKFRNKINELNVNSVEELQSIANNLRWTNPGYMLYSEDRKYRSKVENCNFVEVQNLVKDHGDINYLLLDSMYKKKNISKILRYYPEYRPKLIALSKSIYDYSTNLHAYYIKCKVKKVFVDLERIYRKPLCDLHNLYKNNQKNGNKNFKITYAEVCNLLSTYDIAYLHSIICNN